MRRERRAARPHSTFFSVREPAELMPFLMQCMDGISRTKVKSLLAHRAVLVEGKVVTRYDFPLQPGMKVQLGGGTGQAEFRSSLLKIVYEDDFLIVINKREGLLSIATERQKERTAYSILTEYVRRSDRQRRIFIVHRLDKDTSGLMVFAKDEQTKRILQDNWERIVTDRRYVAVLSGELEQERGTVVSWLKDNRSFITYSSPVDNGGDRAVTHYRVIRRGSGYTLVELELETGKKNQIRVHMQDLQHPVVGDVKYGNGDNPLHRLGLHAFKLCFYHPVSGQLMQFETPFPAPFVQLF